MDLKDFSRMFGDDVQPDEEMMESAQKYQGMDENQLMRELLNNVNSAKTSGDFNYNELIEFANNIFPFLGEAQRARLIELLRMIN